MPEHQLKLNSISTTPADRTFLVSIDWNEATIHLSVPAYLHVAITNLWRVFWSSLLLIQNQDYLGTDRVDKTLILI